MAPALRRCVNASPKSPPGEAPPESPENAPRDVPPHGDFGEPRRERRPEILLKDRGASGTAIVLCPQGACPKRQLALAAGSGVRRSLRERERESKKATAEFTRNVSSLDCAIRRLTSVSATMFVCPRPSSVFSHVLIQRVAASSDASDCLASMYGRSLVVSAWTALINTRVWVGLKVGAPRYWSLA